MVYSDNGKIVAEMFPNKDYLTIQGIADVAEAFNNKVEEINSDLPTYKRITKTIIRDEEFEKQAQAK